MLIQLQHIPPPYSLTKKFFSSSYCDEVMIENDQHQKYSGSRFEALLIFHAKKPITCKHYSQAQRQTKRRVISASTLPEICSDKSVSTSFYVMWNDDSLSSTVGHPVVLCTDDSGVFSTSLSKEYAIAANSFKLDQVTLLTLAEAAIEYCFLHADEKESLRSRFEGYRMAQARIGSQRNLQVPMEPVLDNLAHSGHSLSPRQ